MSGKYIITEEEINQILLHSPYALSTNPARDGLRGEQVKRYFYDFIPVLAEKLNSKMVDVENEMNEHKSSEDSHLDIRGAVDGAMEKATQAYDLATGKSKVHIYPEYKFLFYDLNSEEAKENLNIQKGDIILVAQKNIPDFIVYSTDGRIPSNPELTNVVTKSVNDENVATIEPSSSEAYYFVKSKIAIIGIESGIDTSVFATKEDLGASEEKADKTYASKEELGTETGALKLLYEETLETDKDEIKAVFDKRVNELFIYMSFGAALDADASKSLLVRTDGGLQYFTYQPMTLNNKLQHWTCHAKEIAKRCWQSLFHGTRFQTTQGISTSATTPKLSYCYRDPEKDGTKERYVGSVNIKIDGANIISGSVIKIYGREVNE